MTLSDSVSELKGIGPKGASKFAALGIHTIAELVNYYPRRYEDYSKVLLIRQLSPGQVTIKAVIKQATGRYVRRGMHITEAVASDESGSVRLVWFNQPYRAAALKQDQHYYISGVFELRRQRLVITNPSVELTSDFPVNTARIVPVYRESKGLTSLQIRQALRAAVPLMSHLPEQLPEWLVSKYKLVSYAEALMAMHFPDSKDALEAARYRLGLVELFQLSLASLLNKQAASAQFAPAVGFNESLAKDFVAHLPFKLTDSQKRVVWQIYLDMQKEQPMNRLVEGDVGSGKTVVAAMAAVMVLHNGHQVALMAPTELLARQHAATLYTLLAPLGYADQVGLLVGSMTASQKKIARQNIKQGALRFIVGTHALIQEQVDMHQLELVIIDEQHRFGVEQRKNLLTKAGHMPHVLSLTATPIPRSLALTLYGELDVSQLNEKPAGRQPIATKIVSPNSTAQLYKKIEAELANGRQAYVVCPMIEENESLGSKSVEKVYQDLTKIFKTYRLGLLHGKLKAVDKNAVMGDFINHKLDLLVATTVIEVGVDVPNATVMLIEDAERFGLAQIHQLRGRVGRSKHQGYCFLLLTDSSPPSRRLRALEASQDGFKLAELDLEIRGPGAIYGTMQHGQLDLRVAQLGDRQLVATARRAAQEFIEKKENLLKYKELAVAVMRLQAVTSLN